MFLLNLFVLPLIISILSFNILVPKLDEFICSIPNDRSSHSKEIATGGGIIFAIISTLFGIFSNNLIFMYCLPLSVIGLIDDKFEIKALWRYLIQLLVCTFLVTNIDLQLSFPLLLIAIFTGTAIINFTNFMDGIDGLVVGCMLVIFATASLQFHSLLPLIASLLVYLNLNWSPARLFMGDSGSTYLGGVFFALLIQYNNWLDSLAFLLISAPLIGDAFLCVIIRYINGRNVFKAHRSHLYQRLVRAGISHSKVSTFYILATMFLAVSFILGGIKFLLLAFSIEIIVVYYINKYYAINFIDS